MQAWGVQPNQLSYNTIMDAYARQGNVRNVVKIYNFMQVLFPPQQQRRRALRSRSSARRVVALSRVTLSPAVRHEANPLVWRQTHHDSVSQFSLVERGPRLPAARWLCWCHPLSSNDMCGNLCFGCLVLHRGKASPRTW